MTLLGIAITLISVLGRIARFVYGDYATNYLGLTPVVRQSGGKSYEGSITKAGSSTKQAMLMQGIKSTASSPDLLEVSSTPKKTRDPHRGD